MKKTLGMMSAAVLMSAAGAMGGTTVPTFQGLGDIPERPFSSNPSCLSDDGKIVAGYGTTTPSDWEKAFRWTAETGMQDIWPLTRLQSGNVDVSDMSADGSVIIGNYQYKGEYLDLGVPIAFTTKRGFYWTEAGGMVDIANPDPDGRGECQVYCTTDDGQTFFGTFMPTYPGPAVAGKWTASEGWTAITAAPPARDTDGDGRLGLIFSCSSDGSVLGGTYEDPDGDFLTGRIAFRWTAADGLVLLDAAPGNDLPGEVLGMSADGTTIVGRTNSSGSPYRWKAGEGTLLLGDLPGGSSQGAALSVTGDGSVVVGYTGASGGDKAFIWDATNGIRNLQTVLIDLGTPTVATWQSLRSYRIEITPDGRFIAGLGRNDSGSSEAFLVDFGAPEVPTCPADFNGDDVRDVSDLFAYINAWLAKTTDADFNADTTVDVSDLFAYINAWLAGC